VMETTPFRRTISAMRSSLSAAITVVTFVA
jgi:hypothetical protein